MKKIILNGEESNYVIDEDGNVYGKRGMDATPYLVGWLRKR